MRDSKRQSKDAVVLTSGGVDSTALLLNALQRYRRVFPVYIRCGFVWEKAEQYWLRKMLRRIRSPRLMKPVVLETNLKRCYGNHWSTNGRKVPGKGTPDHSVYLPGRNLVNCSQAAVFAAQHRIPVIEIGVLKRNPFADGKPIFFKRIARLLSEVLGFRMEIHFPFRTFEKKKIVSMIPQDLFELTFSCIHPRGLKPCLRCNKCAERMRT